MSTQRTLSSHCESCRVTALDSRGTASSQGPLMAALNLCILTSHMGQMKVTKVSAHKKVEVSSTDCRASSAATPAAMATVTSRCAVGEAAATCRRQYGPRMYSSRDSSSCRSALGRAHFMKAKANAQDGPERSEAQSR